MSSILNVFAILNNGSVCALYLLPVIILNAFFVIYKFQHKHNSIVKYQNVCEEQLKYNIANVIYLDKE